MTAVERASVAALRQKLAAWQEPLALRAIDCQLALHLAQLAGDEGEHLLLAVALVSRASADGHVCLDLAQLAGRPLIASDDERETWLAPPLALWRQRLSGSAVVGRPGERAPLVLDRAGRLYLHRYWHYEHSLADNLRRRVAGAVADHGLAALQQALDRLFPASSEALIDWQKVAAAAAALQGFCVISGGPGTGKTSTVARLLALLLEQHCEAAPLRIALVAPTGKAAARLQESLSAAVPHIATSEAVRAAIPLQASTIHRLLGVREHSTQFRHDAGRQLPCDVVVVDEASMVDLALMSKLVEAVPAQARLILLGDKDQLASVEAGAVLGELCAGGAGWSAAMAARLSRLSGQAVAPEPSDDAAIGDAVVVLRHSYRFGADSGIGQLAGAVNRGDAAAALRVLEEGAFADVSHWVPAQNQALEQGLLEEAAAAYGDFFDAVACDAAPAAVFDAFNRFRFLCAHRLGPASAGQVNELITRWVRRRYRYYGDDPWYAGRPVMVVRNDYATGLFNGDVGIALPDAEREGRLGVFFQGQDGATRAIAPVRLPPHETVYAMTVHKSQGTEFDRVTLILPERASGVVSRELVYTGLTRARRRVRIVASPNVLRRAIRHRLARASGLRDQLRWQDSATVSPGGSER